MIATQKEVRYTPEDLLSMDDAHLYELVEGRLVERNMGAESSLIALVINALMRQHAAKQQLGFVFGSDCGYQIFPDDPDKVRYPDGSFIARGRLTNNQVPRGQVRIAADLMLEVVSPNDLAWQVDLKVDEYLRAGVKLVWVFYPDTRTVIVYRPGKDATRLGEKDELSGEDVLPGFVSRIAEIFPP